MLDYEFTLRYQKIGSTLSDSCIDDALFEAGFNDALITRCGSDILEINFDRAVKGAVEVFESALKCANDVLNDDYKLIEVKPDYVGVTDIAEHYDVKRQYIQKIIGNNKIKLTPITVIGKTSIYRLADVFEDIDRQLISGLSVSLDMRALANFTRRINDKCRNAKSSGEQ